jgi:hypothetical protein
VSQHARAIVARVLKYLDTARDAERDPWLADDIQVARNAVLNAANGVRDPWGFAFWIYYGKTLSKALIAWREREERNQRALGRCVAMVAQRASQLYVTALAATLPPKKPSQSVRPNGTRRKVA